MVVVVARLARLLSKPLSTPYDVAQMIRKDYSRRHFRLLRSLGDDDKSMSSPAENKGFQW